VRSLERHGRRRLEVSSKRKKGTIGGKDEPSLLVEIVVRGFPPRLSELNVCAGFVEKVTKAGDVELACRREREKSEQTRRGRDGRESRLTDSERMGWDGVRYPIE